MVGKFHEEFNIVSKHQIYKIPIYANIVDEREFDELEKETEFIETLLKKYKLNSKNVKL